ncbi:hypothetical protein DFH06DRAFT_1437866 [Mycena polygramma]|nr:hypothetical protein DFH06DRAFT_1437866 [Mycena polygramma]
MFTDNGLCASTLARILRETARELSSETPQLPMRRDDQRSCRRNDWPAYEGRVAGLKIATASTWVRAGDLIQNGGPVLRQTVRQLAPRIQQAEEPAPAHKKQLDVIESALASNDIPSRIGDRDNLQAVTATNASELGPPTDCGDPWTVHSIDRAMRKFHRYSGTWANGIAIRWWTPTESEVSIFHVLDLRAKSGLGKQSRASVDTSLASPTSNPQDDTAALLRFCLIGDCAPLCETRTCSLGKVGQVADKGEGHACSVRTGSRIRGRCAGRGGFGEDGRQEERAETQNRSAAAIIYVSLWETPAPSAPPVSANLRSLRSRCPVSPNVEAASSTRSPLQGPCPDPSVRRWQPKSKKILVGGLSELRSGRPGEEFTRRARRKGSKSYCIRPPAQSPRAAIPPTSHVVNDGGKLFLPSHFADAYDSLLPDRLFLP